MSSYPSRSRAVRVHAFGGNDKLQIDEVDVRAPGEGEVLVRVAGVGVNPVDWKIVRGRLASFIPTEFPFVPGWELSGTIVARGHAARRFADGDAVYGYVRRPTVQHGAYAEYQIVPEAYLAAAPRTVSLADLGAVPLAGLTAQQSLFDASGLQRGETVLVLGASGGVGAFAVQLAKIAGARVIAVASERNEAFVRSLGADEFVAYDRGEATGELAIAPSSVDLLFDCVGASSALRAASALRPDGRAVSITQSAAPEPFSTRPWRYVFVEPNSAQLATLASHIDAGSLHVHVSERLPLARAAEAHALVESGHTRGKVLLVP